MSKPGATGLRRIWNAFFYSMAGLRAALRHEAAFRQICAAAILLLPAAFYLGDTAVEVALLAGSVILVMIVELLNSAVEAVVDRIGAELHVLSGQAKDMGSAAVLLSLTLMVIVWGLLLMEKLNA